MTPTFMVARPVTFSGSSPFEREKAFCRPFKTLFMKFSKFFSTALMGAPLSALRFGVLFVPFSWSYYSIGQGKKQALFQIFLMLF